LEHLGGLSVRNRRTVAARIVAGLAIGASIAALVAACSPGADYPSILDKPAPRADQTMNPDQVKQATDALISDRNRLSSDTQAAQQASAPASTGSTRPAGSAPKP
jgi:outer membrane murein-binding lipoprotein Lpp